MGHAFEGMSHRGSGNIKALQEYGQRLLFHIPTIQGPLGITYWYQPT